MTATRVVDDNSYVPLVAIYLVLILECRNQLQEREKERAEKEKVEKERLERERAELAELEVLT